MTTDVQHWEPALEYVADRLNQAAVAWLLVGSAATAIHGAAIDPCDIDILIATAAEVHEAADALPNRTEQWPDTNPGTWHSSIAQPVLTWVDGSGTTWTFGRWTIQNTKVELANLQTAVPNSHLTETHATQSDAIRMTWRGRTLHVVPVELQIATMIDRDQRDRMEATLAGADLSRLKPGHVATRHHRSADQCIRPTNPVRPLGRSTGRHVVRSTRWRGEGQRIWPSPSTIHLVLVSSRRPIGPRACSF